MLLYLLEYLAHLESGLLVFNYLTIRSILSAITALIFSMLLGPIFIRKLKSINFHQVIRLDGPKSHLESKEGTPTMGGTLILAAIGFSVLLWGKLDNPYVLIVFFSTISFGVVGLIDDYLKISKKTSGGLKAKYKYLIQSILALIIIFSSSYFISSDYDGLLLIPYLKDTYLNIGGLSLLLAYFIIVGSSNAVNLTDGLDGLAIMPAILIAGTLGVFVYLSGNSVFSSYLQIPYLPNIGEVSIILAALAGAGLGFLWYNSYPASVFMGDVGSLSIGATLGTVAVLIKQEIVFFIISGIFVAETLSVILQVGSYKLNKGKRIFLMAPLHHHFEHQKLVEPKIIVRFWIVTIFLVLIGLSSLKLR